MKAIEAMKKYRIPTTTTPEELESSWSKLLTFGDKVVIAGYYYNGQEQPLLLWGHLQVHHHRPLLRRENRAAGGQ